MSAGATVPPGASDTALADTAASGERPIAARLERGAAVGRYLVLDLVGEGGMGPSSIRPCW